MAEQYELPNVQHEHNSHYSRPGEMNTDQSPDEPLHPHAGDAIDRAVLKKLDSILLPFLCVFFLINSLDRANIGNAETASYTRDVGLDRSALNRAVAWFFAFFVALQPVGAALGRKFGMVLWVPSIMTLWGLLTILHIFVRAEWQLILLRIIIGCLEAGFYPVTVAYMSLFYTRFEFARRLGFFYGQLAVAGALGGFLSFLVFSAIPPQEDDDKGRASGVKSWQVLFVLEGALTMVIAITGYYFLPHGPGSAWFLTTDEKLWAEERIKRDRSKSHTDASVTKTPTSHNVDEDDQEENTLPNGEHSPLLETIDIPEPSSSPHAFRELTNDRGLSSQDIFSAVIDWKVWYLLILNILSAIPATAFSVFLPLVVQGLSLGEAPGDQPELPHYAARANLYTVPPFLIGALVLFAFTYWSDRRRERLIPILCGLSIMIVGLVLTVMLPRGFLRARYVALIILLAGSFVPSPLTIAWLTNNNPNPGKRSLVLGINGWGNAAGVISALIFTPSATRDYEKPLWFMLGFVAIAFLGFLIFDWVLVKENAWRRKILATWDDEERGKEERYGLGSLPPTRLSSMELRNRAVDILTRRFKLKISKGRHGDEKITFQYGL